MERDKQGVCNTSSRSPWHCAHFSSTDDQHTHSYPPPPGYVRGAMNASFDGGLAVSNGGSQALGCLSPGSVPQRTEGGSVNRLTTAHGTGLCSSAPPAEGGGPSPTPTPALQCPPHQGLPLDGSGGVSTLEADGQSGQ